jgi:hypothetical protein
MAALLALVHALHAGLSHIYRWEERVLDGRGLSPSLLLAVPQQHGDGT